MKSVWLLPKLLEFTISNRKDIPMKNKIFAIVINFICLFIICTMNVHAYFDPGVGSMMIQILAAAALSIGVGWRFIVSFVRKKLFKKDIKKIEDNDSEEDKDDEEDNINNKKA